MGSGKKEKKNHSEIIYFHIVLLFGTSNVIDMWTFDVKIETVWSSIRKALGSDMKNLIDTKWNEVYQNKNQSSKSST